MLQYFVNYDINNIKIKCVEYFYAIQVVSLKYTVIIKDVLRKLHGNHKAKMFNKYTNDKEKRIKVYCYKNYQFTRNIAREKERNERTTKQSESY